MLLMHGMFKPATQKCERMVLIITQAGSCRQRSVPDERLLSGAHGSGFFRVDKQPRELEIIYQLFQPFLNTFQSGRHKKKCYQ